jgi:hypothetical protein
LKALEDKPHQTVPQGRPFILTQRSQGRSVELYRSRAGLVETGTQTEQSGLATTRRPHDGQGIAALQAQVHAAENRQLPSTGLVSFSQARDPEDGLFDIAGTCFYGIA